MKRVILLVAAAISVVCLAAAGIVTAQNALPEVRVAACRIQTVQESFTCIGTVVAREEKSVCLADISRVGSVFVAPGDRVEEGQPLFTAAALRESTEHGIADFLASALSEQDLLGALQRGESLAEVFESLVGPELATVFSAGESMVYYAPLSGLVTSVSVQENGAALPGLPCVTVTDDQSLAVQASVPEQDLHRVFLGQEAVVTVRGANQRLSGRVASLPTTVEKSGGLLSEGEQVGRVRIDLQSGEGILAGMSATVRLITETTPQALTVPYTALREDAEGSYLLTTDGETVQRTAVACGVDLGEYVQVTTADGAPFYYLTDGEEIAEGTRIRCVLAD